MHPLDPATLAALFGVAAVAGFVDALAGGGGLLTLPALLLAGMPPLAALATNKLQSTVGSGVATATVARHGLLRPRPLRGALAAAFLGSAGGAALVARADLSALRVVVPVVLGGICLYVLLAPKAGEVARAARMPRGAYAGLVAPLIGAYDGAFGPGTGSFFALSAVALRGATLIEATAAAKALNFATNVAAAAVFLAGGRALWPAALAMGCGQALGAVGGGRTLARGGTRWIRPLIVVMCLGMLARYSAAR